MSLFKGVKIKKVEDFKDLGLPVQSMRRGKDGEKWMELKKRRFGSDDDG